MKHYSYMIKIIANGQEAFLPEGADPLITYSRLGVGFNCRKGECGTCKIRVIKGKENINFLTEQERNFGLLKNERLACQCRELKGDIEFKNAGEIFKEEIEQLPKGSLKSNPRKDGK